MGHLYYLTSRTEEAQDCYERTLVYTTEASDMHAIYLRLASIYLEKGEVSFFVTYKHSNIAGSKFCGCKNCFHKSQN